MVVNYEENQHLGYKYTSNSCLFLTKPIQIFKDASHSKKIFIYVYVFAAHCV